MPAVMVKGNSNDAPMSYFLLFLLWAYLTRTFLIYEYSCGQRFNTFEMVNYWCLSSLINENCNISCTFFFLFNKLLDNANWNLSNICLWKYFQRRKWYIISVIVKVKRNCNITRVSYFLNFFYQYQLWTMLTGASLIYFCGRLFNAFEVVTY